jgi:hypothetical protein
MVEPASSAWRYHSFKHKLPTLLCVALFAVGIGSARAEAESVDQAGLDAFMQSQLLHDLVHDALQHVPPAVFQTCPGLVSNETTLTVLKPISFDGDGGPKSGAWIVRIPVNGCGNDTTLNIHFSAQAGKKINYTVALPGDTRADIPLQRDALMYASAGAMRLTKDCEDVEITDTKFEGFGLSESPDPHTRGREDKQPWRETWTVTGCGHIVDVPMQFVPDATGTQIIQPDGATERR